MSRNTSPIRPNGPQNLPYMSIKNKLAGFSREGMKPLCLPANKMEDFG